MKYQTILLNGTKVEYRIIPKNNKNTYFKFRKNGTIEITKSRYQSKRDIIKFMRQNADQFVHKLSKVKVDPIIKDGHYSYFGQELKIEHHELLKVDVDLENQIIYLPSEEIDPNRLIIRKAERNQLLLETEQLVDKYIDNPYVDIKGITVKTRHTKTRFGSCNAKRRSINLNANLVHYDKKYLEYVFLHEIAHLTYQNHSKEYYNLLEQLCPNYKELRKELRDIYR